ncbi:MAG: BNR/Asp-box repeat protein [Actinomycetia bacterium]|nr:BNR/Asp-box repeat protein [Actinomycetes bacterium]
MPRLRSVVVVLGVVAIVGSSTQPLASAQTAAGAPVLTGLSWTSPTRGWAVGTTNVCADPVGADAVEPLRCVEQLFSTTDRGRSWTAVGSTDGLVDIHFANRDVGYSFNATHSSNDSGSGFAMTTNGGRNWTPQPGPHVAALTVAGRNVVRVSYTRTGCPGPCDWRIQTAAVGSTRWRTAPSPKPRFNNSVQLVHGGTNGVYAAFFGHTAGGAPDQTTDLLVSRNGGRTWAKRSDPCSADLTNEKDTVAIAAAAGGVVATLCYPRGATAGGYVKVSRDGARSFGRAKLIPDSFLADTVAIASARDVFLSTPFDLGTTAGPRLFASHDGGTKWTTVITEGPHGAHRAVAGTDLVGFLNSRSGYWVGGGQTIWTTADAGRSWTMNPSPGG